MAVRIKRAYDPPDPSDGYRVLVDRLWPRGVRKEKARVDEWLRGIAPAGALRVWFAHDPAKWEEFRARYRNELNASGKMDDLAKLAARARKGTVTLLFGARDRQRNNAAALREILEERM
jgi:uncharacterized protein YeaO (DUF488 family)